MKKEYNKPEIMVVLLQTSNLLQTSTTTTFSVSNESVVDGYAGSSEYSGNGGDEDW